MKKCVYCGADLEDQAAFCTRCGKPAGEGKRLCSLRKPGAAFRDALRAGPGYYGGPVPGRYNGMAIASLVLGIVGIFFNGLYLVPSILAIIFGDPGKIPDSQGSFPAGHGHGHGGTGAGDRVPGALSAGDHPDAWQPGGKWLRNWTGPRSWRSWSIWEICKKYLQFPEARSIICKVSVFQTVRFHVYR